MTTVFAAQYKTDGGAWVDIEVRDSEKHATKAYFDYKENIGHYPVRLIRREETVLLEFKGRRSSVRAVP